MTMIHDEISARAWLGKLAEADAAALSRLERLAELLLEENARQNLVSATSMNEIWRRHIVDSAQLLRFVPRETLAAGPWLDLGTGAGFPGLVIAALLPAQAILMVESRPRRCEWLERACEQMGLSHAKVIASRLELVPTVAASVISARAFAPLDKLIALSARFSTVTTRWLLPKGQQAAQELQALVGWQHRFHVEHSLTAGESGIIVGELVARAPNAHVNRAKKG